MKTSILLLILFTFTSISFGKEPLFVFIEYDPWAMVIGSDSPSFVIYSDSSVIFLQSYEDVKKRKKGKGFKLYSTKLNDSLFNRFENTFLDRAEIDKLREHYNLVNGVESHLKKA